MSSSASTLPDAETLAQLVWAAKADAPDGVERFLHAVRPWVVGYFTRHRLEDQAEDLAQQVLLRLARAVGRMVPAQAGWYIAAVARRERLRAQRRGATHRLVSLERASALPASVDVMAEVETLELWRAVHVACLAVLEGELRETMLAHLRGADTAALAARFGISRGAVRTRLQRARATLRQALVAYLPHDPDPPGSRPQDSQSPDHNPTNPVSHHDRRSGMSTSAQLQPSLQHLAFFQSLSHITGDDPMWASTTAGLLSLRLVDRWAEDGHVRLSTDSAEVRSVLAAVEAIDPGSVYRGALRSLVDAVTARRNAAAVSEAVQRIAAYARALQYDAQWALAADVYRTLVTSAPVDAHAETLTNGYVQLGYCLRMMGESDAALSTYRAAAWIAAQCGQPTTIVRAKIGEANVTLQRGNLPAAESMLDEAISTALAQPDVAQAALSQALHDRAHVAYRRRQFEEAAIFCHRALAHCEHPTERDRVLVDLATFLGELGQRDAARKAFLILAATAQEQYVRWAATINLLELTTLEGDETVFERLRQELASASLSPAFAAEYHLLVGLGHQRFGRSEAAREALGQALRVAREYQLNETAFRVEATLRSLEVLTPPTITTAPPPSEAVAEIVRTIDQLRAEAGA